MSIRELPLLGPLADREGKEILRVIDDKESGKLLVVLDVFGLDTPDPGGWGILLVDVANHVANALEGRLGTPDGEVSRDEILARIKELFDKEWAKRTDAARRLTDA